MNAPTIAVVDDDDSVRAALDNLLRSMGMTVVTFGSAEEFLDSPRRDEVSCLVADVQMPGMGGLALHRQLAAESRRVPIILITAFPKDHVRREVEADGAFGYLAKPFESASLLACIDRALDEGHTGA
ncbi:response regulator transcription factor [Reyranella sp.]|uniref:response regulator transcription factor n=1 Tax=Reyranella sp. TaxID=1929291 RepID=UPI003BAB1377